VTAGKIARRLACWCVRGDSVDVVEVAESHRSTWALRYLVRIGWPGLLERRELARYLKSRGPRSPLPRTFA
jgi:hypothetical protein